MGWGRDIPPRRHEVDDTKVYDRSNGRHLDRAEVAELTDRIARVSKNARERAREKLGSAVFILGRGATTIIDRAGEDAAEAALYDMDLEVED